MTICIGNVRIGGQAILAPMSGVTDAPFRRLARHFGADLTVTEMIASRCLVDANREALRRLARDGGAGPLVVQLAGADPAAMAEAARLCQDLGAAMIDINMGCPVKKVANRQQAGAALMRDEAKALRLIDATVGAVALPVSLKIRLGWDRDEINAPTLARRAEAAGITLVTVHGRTRMQGFGGRADWDAIARVKAAVSIPVVANGDVATLDDAANMLERSGADAVMIGRGACGRPWFPGAVARFLASGTREPEPPPAERRVVALEHYRAMLSHYGAESGRRNARKHLGWYLERAGADRERRQAAQREETPAGVERMLAEAYDRAADREAA